MGLMDIFGRGPLSDKKIEKVVKMATNPFAQPDVRVREMQRLLSDGSPAALLGALKRFAVNANGQIADEDEKKWLEDLLVEEIGRSAVEPLRTYIRREKQLTYALRAYGRLAGDDESVRFFIEVLNQHGPDSHRALDAKLQLIWQLSEHLEDPRVVPCLVDFITDHSDDIRFAVLDLLERAAKQNLLGQDVLGVTCDKLGELLFDEHVGPRIQRRVADLLMEQKWQVPGTTTELPTMLTDDYFVDKKRYVRARAHTRKA